MLRARIIPCLLVHQGGLVKTQTFKAPKYVGDPINAVKIFNEKEADELIVLDIDASVHRREPDFRLIAKLAAECRMPLCYGGGIFLQAIEGGRIAVSDLYGHIQKDPRHKDVVLLHYEEISERRFGGWTMGQVDTSRVNTNILLKYSERAELDPYNVSGKVSLALLEELMATASIIGRA